MKKKGIMKIPVIGNMSLIHYGMMSCVSSINGGSVSECVSIGKAVDVNGCPKSENIFILPRALRTPAGKIFTLPVYRCWMHVLWMNDAHDTGI